MKKFSLIMVLSLSVFLNAGYNGNSKIPKQCQNKIYCSQMKSCKEAKYYLKLCGKYAKMDGDRDGVPCERQWCQPNKKF